MCLTVLKNPNNSKEKFKTRQQARDGRRDNVLNAIENIRVYKALYKQEDQCGIMRLLSPHRGMEYVRGKTFKVSGFSFRVHRWSKWEQDWSLQINRGLHAYRSEHAARKNYGDDVKYGTHSIYEMYIPKGAKYFVGEDGEIVSNELVFKPLPRKVIR